MLFISPPFGNYIEIKNCISIKGSFTLNERPGLICQIFKTLRYSFEHKGWVNKIGLRNKGLDYAIKKYKNTNHIVSIAILNKGEISLPAKKDKLLFSSKFLHFTGSIYKVEFIDAVVGILSAKLFLGINKFSSLKILAYSTF